jgi:acetyl esterase/lipase
MTYLFGATATVTHGAETLKLWPGGRAPGDTMELAAESDLTKPNEGLVAGKRLIRLGNVSEPEIHFFAAPADKANGTCVVICPGGGHRILAWDLEGTEVAQWLNELGVSVAVLKYRVPARTEKPRYQAAVQDAQRALSLVRSRAGQWNINPNKIGILGFSAGGETAALATLLPERLYSKLDSIDDVAWKPNFTVLIYPAYLVNKDNTALMDHVKVDDQTPPMFLAHAANDPVRPESSVLLWLELKKHNIPAELHVFSQGGHGYGLRATDLPVTGWPQACAAWLRTEKWIP